jgi:hypothetical protein
VLWPKIGHVGPTCQFGRPCNLARRPSFLLAPSLGIGYLEHNLWWTHRQNGFLEMLQHMEASQGDVAGRPHHGLVEPVLCATSFYRVILSVTMLILGTMKICLNFGSYGAFPSSNVPEMVFQRNSWNSLVISTYLLYLKWNVGMLAVNICILWPSTPPPPPTHTHLEFCSSLSKRKELNPRDISKKSSAITARE